ncbi:aldose epimerase family protein [Flavobacterium sedimenticola]|uniref:Aldose 1-epimerase n=1 Tax=Flavobacterium sedimenticola TaxID=3043286 RepID=A0ABT6XRW7_9FLAO|nr:aldose epimerase family protein [Flavobacterium sedimenticola]MDI9257831.1 aldose epimerase family protein [Flavobacterium sedimenticola]
MFKNHISQNNPSLNEKFFGLTPENQEVFCYTLTNKQGMEVSVINYGATITSIKIPNSNGIKTDVVLGFDKLESYINSFNLPSAPYLGAVVGRYAGRINNASFILNGEKIQLTSNHNRHQIHGGSVGFSQKVWTVKSIPSEETQSIILEYLSVDNEENFPGELSVRVTYTLTDQNELKVEFSAKSTEDTIVNLTQHSYFNLNGHQENINHQKITINADTMLETTEELIPTGKFISLKNHDYDFSTTKDCPAIIDNTFVLNDTKAATMYGEKSKIKMTVITNQPAVHVYVGGNCFDQIKGKEATEYHKTSGICFETQNFPDAPNHSHFPTAVLGKNEWYSHQTIFKFENL